MRSCKKNNVAIKFMLLIPGIVRRLSNKLYVTKVKKRHTSESMMQLPVKMDNGLKISESLIAKGM